MQDAIEVISAKGDLPPILLSGCQSESHHPLAATWLRRIRQPLQGERPSLTSFLAFSYRATLRVDRWFLHHRLRVAIAFRICIAIRVFLWWTYKLTSKV